MQTIYTTTALKIGSLAACILMVFILLAIGIFALTGCALTPPMPPNPKTSMEKQSAIEIAFSNVTLTWSNNYNLDTWPNEQTVIIGSPDPTLPRNQWVVIYAGTNGTCQIPATEARYFFSAYNSTTNI